MSWIGLTLALTLFSLNSVWLAPLLVWVVLGVGYFALSLLANTTRRRFDLDAHDRLATWGANQPAPSVDVFLPNCGEPIEVLETTFRHVAALEHEGPRCVYCLDDVGRGEVAALARRFGFVYLSRPNKGEFKKAGNLRYAYLRSSGDFIVIFDADFSPRVDFISQLLPYAQADADVGIVQSPQYFDVSPEKGWLENGAGAVQEFFYRWVMPARDVRHSPICVGTNAVYRRRALQETDGGALVENSEDVHTGFDLMCKGYRTKYVPVIMAKGLCPNTLDTFFNQQHRWCSGSMSLLFSRKFWRAPIGLRPRLTFLAGMTYFLYTGLGVLILPIPTVVMVCAFPAKVLWINYVLLVPALVHNFVLLPRWHRQRYGFSAMRTKIVYAWAHLFAFRDRLTGRGFQWRPTGGSLETRPSRRLLLVRILLVGWPLAGFAGVVAGSALHMSSPLDVDYWPPLLFACVWTTAAICVLRPLGTTRYVEGGQPMQAAEEPVLSIAA